MNLSKALKLKNKKVTEQSETLNLLLRSNSYDVDSKKIYNSKELLEKYEKQVNDLVKLKTAIHLTSEPIRSKIFMLSELKASLTRLGSLDTLEGTVKQTTYAGNSAITYKVDIDELTKQQIIKQYQDDIERIQDEIDVFNATTELKGYE